jgi:putative alpha-1,2-mannosidase
MSKVMIYIVLFAFATLGLNAQTGTINYCRIVDPFIQNTSPENKFIQSATLNGKPLTQIWLRHTDIMNGGSLSFVMGNKLLNWSSNGQLPPSMLDKN